MEVVEGVAVFGENDELPWPPVAVGGESMVLQDRGQFGPLAVGAGITDLFGESCQGGEFEEFGVEFLHGLRRRCGVEEFFFEFFDLVGVVVVGVEAR